MIWRRDSMIRKLKQNLHVVLLLAVICLVFVILHQHAFITTDLTKSLPHHKTTGIVFMFFANYLRIE